MRPSHHLVAFLCNDDHGLPTGHVEQIDIPDDIRIYCTKARPPTFRKRGKRFNVGRYYYECLGWQSWVGNIFWDGATMHVAETRRLLRNLLADGWAIEEWAEQGPFAHLARRRLRGFLGAFLPMSFSVAELMEAIGGSEAAMRKALTRLGRAKLVERVCGRRWRARL